MKTATTVCGKCGAKIFGEATREVCPACLLESGLRLLDEESLAGGVDLPHDNGVPVPDRKTRQRLAGILGDFGDYELLEEIGRGGQGVVYRARQKSLNRTVALKVIGLGQWATEAHLKRFRLEAEAAARLDHPCIVPIHEVGERDGSCYFSMKLVEGGQLDEVVRHSPMSTRQAAELIAKVARTVHYAHEHGILHRDIKPGNILLDAKGEPHLTDFGLARLVETESTVTGTKEVLGTPSYMAPEQAGGNNTKLSGATDVYGLGAVLYQLLTGHPPFAGGTTYETVKLLLETEPRPPRLLNPKIDRDLSTICLKCLEKDPQRRYPAAAGLAEDLEHWLRHEPILARHTGIFAHGKKWVRRKPAIAAVIALSLAFATAIGWNIWKSELFRAPPEKSIAVLPFQNLSPDPDNAYFADGIQEEILTRLASIADLKVISRTSTQRYQSKARNLSQIAKQLGVANILEGSVQKAGDQVRVNVQLINAQTDSHLWAETFDRKLIDIFEVQTEVAKRIAESLQVKLTGREEQALAVKPTNNPEAYDAYLRGLAFDGRNYGAGYSVDLASKVSGSYELAVKLDPNFALAWARLSRVKAESYNFLPLAASSVQRDAAKHALENAQRLEPNSPETLLALGWYQFLVLRDYGAATTTFTRVSKLSPVNSQVLSALGKAAWGEKHPDESIAYFEQALALDPRNLALLSDSAEIYAMLRQFPAAVKIYDRMLDIAPNDPNNMAAKANIYQPQGNLREAARFLPEMNWQTPPLNLFVTKVNQLRLERNYGEAIRLLQARLAQFHFASQDEKGICQNSLAWIQHLAGDTAGARATAEQARNIFEPAYRDQSDNAQSSPRALAFLAQQLSWDYALIGEKDLAIKTAERAIMHVPRGTAPTIGASYEENLALIQTMFGENRRAISILTELLQTPYYSNMWYGPSPITRALLRLDPLWDPLRGDPAFQKLCEEKKP
jgi:serine/threonine protein kinase/Tfp pilus assembly protein PilF